MAVSEESAVPREGGGCEKWGLGTGVLLFVVVGGDEGGSLPPALGNAAGGET